jgi:outer membrane receptor for ferrienterochelin and colicins
MVSARAICCLMVVGCATLGGGWAAAETAPASRRLTDLTLDELLNMEVQVASAEPQVTREAPAVVTVVTREEIQESGARDLIDVLRMVAGFDFGVDVWGVVGIGFRGLWGHDAKIMLAVDGMVMNEPMYGNLEFGNHIPVDQIERIEIVRGAGSVIHGNYAELAVINVITSIGDQRSGLRAGAVSGWFDHDYARANFGASYGGAPGRDSYLGISAFGATAQRSVRRYTDIYGDSYGMDGNSDLKTVELGLHYRRGGFQTRFLYDGYRTTSRDADGAILSTPLSPDFTSYLANVSYCFSPRPGLTITPELQGKLQQPWRNDDDPNSEIVFYDPTAQSCTGILKVNWDPSRRLAVLAGGEYAWEGARYGDRAPYLFINGRRSIDYRRRALFAEAYLKTAPVNLTAGLRVEGHSGYNTALVPRIGLTRAFGPAHVKLIYNHAFRGPTIEQINGGANIKTEEADILEFEVGRTLGPTAYLGLNLFEIRMHRPLVYVSQDDAVRNFGSLQSRGVEAEGRVQGHLGHLTARYSFYAADDGQLSYVAVPGEDELTLGFPAHKLTLAATLHVSAAWSVTSTLIWTSARFAYDHSDPETLEPELGRLGPEAPLNLHVLYRGPGSHGLTVGLGVYDLFAANHVFAQPYAGLHAPLPGPGREFLLRIGYGLD